MTPSTDVTEPRSIAVVFGTRPEIVKLAGVIEHLGERALTIYSGQHFDELLSEVFFEELGLPQPHIVLKVGGRSRGQQIGELVGTIEKIFDSARPRAVVVQGDTNTSLGGALAANAVGIPLAHVEAGLRSFDRRMPEEHNRVMADHLSDLCLAPTERSRQNLMREGILQSRIAVTGNTVVDTAVRVVPEADERRRQLEGMGVEPSTFILATFHRPENVDDPPRLRAILEQLASIGLPVVFPVHPRTRARLAELALEDVASQVRVVPPLGYRAFLALASECAFLVSDSGGVQEEASVVKRHVVVVRRSTERPEVLGTFATLVDHLPDVGPVARSVLDRLPRLNCELSGLPSPYGDGLASLRCVREITALVSGDSQPCGSGLAELQGAGSSTT